MMKTRKFYIPDCTWGIGALEDWLEHMAANWARKKMLSTAWETVVEGLFTRVCRVRFSLLAGPLYEEWLDERVHDSPEAVVETLSDDRFDRAALCTYGDRQALYLQQEHYVFEVYARELPDLTGSLDAYAALLDAYTA